MDILQSLQITYLLVLNAFCNGIIKGRSKVLCHKHFSCCMITTICCKVIVESMHLYQCELQWHCRIKYKLTFKTVLPLAHTKHQNTKRPTSFAFIALSIRKYAHCANVLHQCHLLRACLFCVVIRSPCTSLLSFREG